MMDGESSISGLDYVICEDEHMSDDEDGCSISTAKDHTPPIDEDSSDEDATLMIWCRLHDRERKSSAEKQEQFEKELIKERMESNRKQKELEKKLQEERKISVKEQDELKEQLENSQSKVDRLEKRNTKFKARIQTLVLEGLNYKQTLEDKDMNIEALEKLRGQAKRDQAEKQTVESTQEETGVKEETPI